MSEPKFLTIKVKCVGCGAKREITAPQEDVPMCDVCFSPMVVESAEIDRADLERKMRAEGFEGW